MYRTRIQSYIIVYNISNGLLVAEFSNVLQALLLYFKV